MTSIYLSSTYSDLKDYREAVYHILRQMQYNVIAMEDYVATDLRPLDKCLTDVQMCDLYIGIFAWRYGHIPLEGNPEHKSITELEYCAAAHMDKTCLVFLLEENTAWPPNEMDVVIGENDRGERIKALRQKLQQGKLVQFFRSPEQLAICVSSAMHVWEGFRTGISLSIMNQPLNLSEEKLERERRLKALLADHSGFIKNRLESFVGRQQELAYIQQAITEKLQTGGYVTITGQAGQGKSSIIAKLVEEYGTEKVAFHFIPFNPGPGHQVGLLRNLMARLILKYDLSDIYVASESRPALRDYFPKVLGELVVKKGQEVIFIDGLDQLEEDQNGVRDLSFLPNDPPPGVVFVLGTRPNDTLRPLELLKPRHEYKLPNLSRDDFDFILLHRKVRLTKELTDQFYKAMQENALYLDLVAKELAETRSIDQVEVIRRVADNPDNIFSLSIDRFKRHERQWRTILKPLLGVLLAAREPMRIRHIRQILSVDDDEIRDGLRRLGGLIAEDGQGRRYLFHLKLQDFLRQDDSNPNKEYIFASDEEILWHAKLADWCEKSNLGNIWQDIQWDVDEQGKHVYARQHYITHLFLSRDWQRLWNVLDEGSYGRGKVQYDPSMRLYAQDLDRGRQASTWKWWPKEKAITLLPWLWKYTLLRCSLTSRADSYTIEAFDALLALDREKEALGLAEMLTNISYKVKILLKIAIYIGKLPNREQEGLQILIRAHEVTNMINSAKDKFIALRDLGLFLIQMQREAQALEVWTEALEAIRIIEDPKTRTKSLRDLSEALLQGQCWEQGFQVVCSIDDERERKEALQKLRSVLIQEKQWDLAKVTARSIENWRERVEAFRDLARTLVQEREWQQALIVSRLIIAKDLKLELQRELLQELKQRQIWELAIEVARSIEDVKGKIEALREVGVALAQEKQEKWALEVWKEAVEIMRTQIMKKQMIEAQRELLQELKQRQIWELAIEVARSIEDVKGKIEALREVGVALAQEKQEKWALEVWKEAVAVAHSINENQGRAEILSNMGLILALEKQEKWALEIWTEAIEIAHSVKDPSGRTKLWRELMQNLLKAQQWKLAENVALSIENDLVRVGTLRELGEALAQEHHEKWAIEVWTKALSIAYSMDEVQSQSKAEVLRDIGVALAQEHHEKWALEVWTKALEATHFIKDKDKRLIMLLELSRALAQGHQWEQAERIARSIENVSMRSEALQEVSRALAQGHQWEQAERIAQSIEEIREKVFSLKNIGIMLANNKDKSMYLKIFKDIIQILDAYSGEKLKGNIELLEDIEEFLEQKQQWKLSITVARLIENVSSKKVASLKNLSMTLVQERQWDLAGVAAHFIHDSWERAKVLNELARMLAQELYEERAVAMWKEIVDSNGSIDDVRKRTELLRDIGKSLALQQQWELAEYAACSIENFCERIKALSELGNVLVQGHQEKIALVVWKKALEIIYSAKIELHKEEAQQVLSRTLIRAQQWDLAKEVASSINNNIERTRILCELSKALAQAQKRLQAEAVLADAIVMKDTAAIELQRSIALCKLSGIIAQAKKWETAEKIARTIKVEEQRIIALYELSKYLAQGGEWETAEKIARTIRVEEQRIIALCELSNAFVQKQNLRKALSVWTDIKDVVRNIGHSEEISSALYHLSKAFLIEKQWNKSLEIIRFMVLGTQKVVALCELGEFLAQELQWQRSISIWSEAEEVSRMIPTREQQLSSLCTLGASLAQAQQWEWANVVWNEFKVISRSIKDKFRKVELLCELSKILMKKRQLDFAKDIFIEAEEITHSIEAKDQKVRALCELSDVLLQRNQSRQAKEILVEAEEIAHSIEGNQKAESLFSVSVALARGNLWEEAILMAHLIEGKNLRAKTMQELAKALTEANENERLLSFVQRNWLQADNIDYTLKLLPIAHGLVMLDPAIGTEFYEAFTWVDEFLRSA